MKHKLLEWLCIDLMISMVWVQTLVKRQRKPSRRAGAKKSPNDGP